MSGEFTDIIDRGGAAAELPLQLASDLIVGVTKDSAAMSLGTKAQARTLDNKIPVVTALPQAYWESQADTGLAQTTDMTFTNEDVTVWPLSTIAVLPNDVVNDSQFALWDAVKPKLVESLSAKIDKAVLFGEGKPTQLAAQASALETAITASGGRLALDISATLTSGSTVVADTSAATTDVGLQVFGPGIPSGTTVASAVAGTSFTLSHAATVTGKHSVMLLPSSAAYALGADVFSTSTDNPSLVLRAAQAVAEAGYAPDGAVTASGWEFRSAAARTQALVANPIGSDQPFNAMLGSLPMRYSPLAGSRNVDALVGRFGYLVVAMAGNISIKMLTEGVISNDSGQVMANLAQQELTAYKVRARIGWYVASPPTQDDSFNGTRSPFAFIFNNTGVAGRVGTRLGTGVADAPAPSPRSGRAR